MMKTTFLLIASLFLIVIIVAAQGSSSIDNWCDAGGPWDDGRCHEGNDYQQEWHWTCGWYMAQVDKGLVTIEDLQENVPFCKSLYRPDYVPNILPATVISTATPSLTPISPTIAVEVTATASPTLTATAVVPTTTPTTVAVTKTPTSTSDGDKILRVGIGRSEPYSIDPALADYGIGEQILQQTYMGLTVIDEESFEVVPALALSWDGIENEDGSYSYIFNLRDDIPWVRYNPDSEQVEAIGRMVKASDFEYAWRRTIQEDYYYASYILAPEVLEVQALGDYTVVITVSHYTAYQLVLFAQWYTFAQPQWVIDELGDTWTEAEHFVSYGPYALKEWIHDKKITLIKNPYWHEAAKIDEIQFLMYDYETQLQDYEAGKLDYLGDIPSSLSSAVHDNPQFAGQLIASPESGIYFYGFNASIEPFDNVHCRRAFSFAINRKVVTDAIQYGQVAPYFSSLNLIGAPQPEDYPNLGISYDPDRALSELNQCLGEKGINDVQQLPRPKLVFNDGAIHHTIAIAIQQMWLDNLGVEVELETVEFVVLIDSRDQFPIWRSGWTADFPDVHNLMGSFASENGYYADLISSPNYDALLEKAAISSELAERTDLYAEANQLLVYDEAMIIPIYWYVRTQLTQPHVIRTISRLNYERFDKWDLNQ